MCAWGLALLLAAGLGGGCERKQPTAERAPSLRATGNLYGGLEGASARGGRPPGGRRDAGMRLDASLPDAGVPDASLPPLAAECFELSPNVSPVIFAPADFAPTHVSASWLTDCREPTIVLTLAEGGCGGGPRLRHELAIYIEAAALEEGRVVLAENPIGALGLGGLWIRYRRAGGLEPKGLWGDCEGADGSITIDQVAVDGGDNTRVAFELRLTDCTGGSAPSQQVAGNISVFQARGLADACP